MNTRFSLLLALGIGAGAALLQAAPSVDEILQKYTEAIGGPQAYKRITTRQVKGVITLAALGADADMTITSKAPNKQHTLIDIPGVGLIAEGYDGKVAWTKNPFVGVIEKSGGELRQAQRQADFYRDVELKSRYPKWAYQGTEDVNGKEAYVLKATAEDGTTDRFFIDSETYLVSQVTGIAVTANGIINTKIRMSDYRKVEGIQVPFSVKLVDPPQAAFSLKITEVNLGVKVDDHLFKKPRG